jgi:hypothetical protein
MNRYVRLQRGAEVVAVAGVGLAGRDTHANGKLQFALRTDRRWHDG